MQQVQKIKQIRLNIGQIISDCKKYRFKRNFQANDLRNNRLKTEPNQNQLIRKRFNYDSCLKNITNRARSLQTLDFLQSSRLKKNNSQAANLIRSDIRFSQRVKSGEFQLNEQQQQYQTLSKSVDNSSLPNIKQKRTIPKFIKNYQRAHCPINASSSEKHCLLGAKQDSSKKLISYQQYPSYQEIVIKRRKFDQMRRISVFRRVLKQKVAKQNKQMVEKKKQRRLQSFTVKQIALKNC